MSAMEFERKEILDTLLQGDFDFEELAFRIFHFQFNHNPLYHDFCRYLYRHPGNISELTQIPFLPVRFFKTHDVKTGTFSPEVIFKSSGTSETGRSRHLVRDLNIYNHISIRIFENNYGSLEDFIILALLPSYLEQGDSSLIYMIQNFMKKTGHFESQFYKYNFEGLREDLMRFGSSSHKKVFLWGVTYSLIDFAEKFSCDMKGQIVLETGGMKGRRDEMIRSEIHETLSTGLNTTKIHSEYGMTEMLSQGYSDGDGVFQMGDTLKIVAFDVTDPLCVSGDETTGRCHVIDLANIDSCSFIATEDLCRTFKDTFEIVGRMDAAEIRGCNLLYVT